MSGWNDRAIPSAYRLSYTIKWVALVERPRVELCTSCTGGSEWYCYTTVVVLFDLPNVDNAHCRDLIYFSGYLADKITILSCLPITKLFFVWNINIILRLCTRNLLGSFWVPQNQNPNHWVRILGYILSQNSVSRTYPTFHFWNHTGGWYSFI